MIELISSLLFAVVMVPLVMAAMIALIYGLGEFFSMIAKFGHKGKSHI